MRLSGVTAAVGLITALLLLTNAGAVRGDTEVILTLSTTAVSGGGFGVRGQLTDTGDGVPGLTVWISAWAGPACGSGSPLGTIASPTTDFSGNFDSHVGLVSGTYSVRASATVNGQDVVSQCVQGVSQGASKLPNLTGLKLRVAFSTSSDAHVPPGCPESPFFSSNASQVQIVAPPTAGPPTWLTGNAHANVNVFPSTDGELGGSSGLLVFAPSDESVTWLLYFYFGAQDSCAAAPAPVTQRAPLFASLYQAANGIFDRYCATATLSQNGSSYIVSLTVGASHGNRLVSEALCATKPSAGDSSATTGKSVPEIPARWLNCAAVRRVYPHGIGRTNAHDKRHGLPPVTMFKRSTKLYDEAVKANPDLDTDEDGIACEKP